MKAEEFEQEWKKYCDSKGGGAVTMNVKDVAKHFAQWQREQMMKDAVNAHIIAIGQNAVVKEDNDDDLRKCIISKFKDGDKVKVIIVKE